MDATQIPPKTSTTCSPLLRLPAELRLEIYELVLRDPLPFGIGGIYSSSRRMSPPRLFGGNASKQAIQPPITLVSKQVRQETLGLFYKLNRFVLGVHYRRAKGEVERWLTLMAAGDQLVTCLRCVTIKHRFGILDFKGTIDFRMGNDGRECGIDGPELWFNAIPPTVAKGVAGVVNKAGKGPSEQDDDGARRVVETLKALIALLGSN